MLNIAHYGPKSH